MREPRSVHLTPEVSIRAPSLQRERCLGAQAPEISHILTAIPPTVSRRPARRYGQTLCVRHLCGFCPADHPGIRDRLGSAEPSTLSDDERTVRIDRTPYTMMLGLVGIVFRNEVKPQAILV